MQSGKMAGNYESRELWAQWVKPAYNAGRLEKIPTRRAVTLREKSQARAQNAVITARSFGAFHENYALIDWS